MCVRACVRACARACVRACVCVCVVEFHRNSVRVCGRLSPQLNLSQVMFIQIIIYIVSIGIFDALYN